ncbi:3-oxoadipate enol-lactonase [Streptomyces sp. RB6PN25]|uniref:3-oxoadipate enol-lactonase n=1 Tax=Streptomyces humicola TaxID=2953240 RepID=A0ABT1Q4C9_9ACTN|nr:3-oxoadipate enol-lactonase [Streptomyces humicola]MCQ4084776.1 3-oxoadipate enol-lactonase [Streptomyces humicola]
MTTPALHHRVDGPDAAPALLLGPSLGTSLSVWDAHVAALARHFRAIRWDLPGHGGTPTDVLPDPTPGATTVADLGRLVLDLADRLGVGAFDFAGISLGGAVGAWLAVHHPARMRSLAMICSSARFGEPAAWHERAALARHKGTGPIADAAAGRWFTPAFADDPTAKVFLDGLRATDPDGYAACCDALADYDLRADLHRITAPALVVAGRDDTATPPAHARQLADAIPEAALVEIPRVAHLATVERPAPVLAALLAHLVPPACDHRPSDDGSRHTAGMAVRRAVLGDAHVDRAVARTSDFTAPFQDFITRYAWGGIWTRPGLDRRTRSCITMTALVAHGHLDELAMHVRAALTVGLTPEEIQEVLLQSAVYCGVPAANAAFAVADRILREHHGNEERGNEERGNEERGNEEETEQGEG